MQMSIRQNAEELQDMLKELNSWQDDNPELLNSVGIVVNARIDNLHWILDISSADEPDVLSNRKKSFGSC